jgi:zinc transporter
MLIDKEPAVGSPEHRLIPGLVWAYRCAADGTAERLADEGLDDTILDHEGLLWLHFSLADARARDWIASHELLPPAARALILSGDDHVRLDVTDDVVIGVFADIRRTFDGTSEDVGLLRFALSDRVMISGRRSALNAVEETRRALDEGKRLTTPVALLEAIIEKFCDAAAQLSEETADKIDLIEDRIVADRFEDERLPLAGIRRTTVRMHRQIMGLHSIFARLERMGRDKLPSPLLEAAHRLATRLDTLHHDIQMLSERARLLQDEVSSRQAAQANRLLHIISVLTALLVPPTLVTGIFGMNTKGLPFTEDPNGFLYAISLCAASAAGVYLLMRFQRPH